MNAAVEEAGLRIFECGGAARDGRWHGKHAPHFHVMCGRKATCCQDDENGYGLHGGRDDGGAIKYIARRYAFRCLVLIFDFFMQSARDQLEAQVSCQED